MSLLPLVPAAVLALLPPADPGEEGAPRIAVLLVVDQMRADYPERFGPSWRHGLRRLCEDGARFTNARHAHANTSTAPGHATISTGAHPRTHGVVANYHRLGDAVVRAGSDPEARMLGRDAPGASARSLLVPAIGDWLERAHPGSLVVSVAIKARAAVLLGGKTPDACFYMDTATGAYTTSTAYADALPEFVRRFNRERPAAAWFGTFWQPRLSDSEFERLGCAPDDAPYEGLRGFGPEDASFPHLVSSVGELPFSPFGDERTLDLAERALVSLGLGRDAKPDLLLVSLSAADYIGHAYGEASREVADYYAWLDARLPRLFDALDRAAGEGRWVLALTSDHGVCPVVERLLSFGLDAGRVRSSALARAIDEELDRRYGAGEWVLQLAPEVHLDRSLVETRGLDLAEVRVAAARAAASVSGVRAAWPFERMLDDAGDIPEPFRLSFHPDRSGDVVVQFERYHHLDYLSVSPYVKANHASENDYDQSIPLIFYGPSIRPATLSEPALSVDIAPTLASILGVEPPDSCEGRSLHLPRTRP